MRILLFVVAVAVANPAAAQPAQNSAAEIEQVMKAFLVPFSNQDVPEFMTFFAADAVVFFPNAGFALTRVEGKADIARTFEKVFTPGRPAPPGGRPLIQPQDLKVQRFDDSAIVTFHLGSNTNRGRRTFVLRRIDSSWRIVHLHASTITAQ